MEAPRGASDDRKPRARRYRVQGAPYHLLIHFVNPVYKTKGKDGQRVDFSEKRQKDKRWIASHPIVVWELHAPRVDPKGILDVHTFAANKQIIDQPQISEDEEIGSGDEETDSEDEEDLSDEETNPFLR